MLQYSKQYRQSIPLVLMFTRDQVCLNLDVVAGGHATVCASKIVVIFDTKY